MEQREFFRVLMHGKTKLMLTLCSALRLVIAPDIAFKIGKTVVYNCNCASQCVINRPSGFTLSNLKKKKPSYRYLLGN